MRYGGVVGKHLSLPRHVHNVVFAVCSLQDVRELRKDPSPNYFAQPLEVCQARGSRCLP